MTFKSHVAGIPCFCRVTRYSAPLSMRVTGSGFGDADPPEPEEFDFHILDLQRHPAPQLEALLTEDDEERLLREYQALKQEAV